jgi:hypothetical protein
MGSETAKVGRRGPFWWSRSPARDSPKTFQTVSLGSRVNKGMFPWAAYGRTTLAGGSVVRKPVATKTRPRLGGPTSHGVILSTPPEPRTDSSVKGQTGRSTENLLSDFRETFMPEVGFPRMQFVGDSFVAVCRGKRLAVAYPRRLLAGGGIKRGSKRVARVGRRDRFRGSGSATKTEHHRAEHGAGVAETGFGGRGVQPLLSRIFNS